MRGFGVAQMAVAHESQMDILAETLKMDPFEIRLKNGLKQGFYTATGQKLERSVGLEKTLRDVRQEIAKRKIPAPSGSKKYGWGIASMFYGCGKTGGANPGRARIAAEGSGDFVLYLGDRDEGAIESAMIQIAAETLEVAPEKIRAVIGDTEFCPDSGTSSPSRTTYTVGRAVQLAATALRDSLREFAASLLGCAAQEIAAEDWTFYRLPPRLPAAACFRSTGGGLHKKRWTATTAEALFNPETTPLDPETGQGSPYATYAFASQGALVSVNTETGEIEVLSIVASHDVGTAVNSLNVTGQIEGGVAIGIGYASMEDIVMKRRAIQNQFTDYIIPTVLDIPEVTSFVVESEEPTGPFGAKGVNEPALLPTAPTIMNAVPAATGVRVRQLPITSESLFTLLEESRSKTFDSQSDRVCAAQNLEPTSV